MQKNTVPPGNGFGFGLCEPGDVARTLSARYYKDGAEILIRNQGKVMENHYLQGIIMYQFQLRILEQLLLFCEGQDAANLTINIHDNDIDYLEIYRRFFVSEEKVITARGEQTQIVIPTDIETYDGVLDFMDEIYRNFRQSLWREQRTNPAFQKYLMCYPG
jgi:hypothetical protein